MDFDYDDSPELYDQAMRAAGHEDVLENDYDPDVYSNPLELLDKDDRRQVVEIAMAEKILNGDTGALAGMENPESASD